QRPGSRQKRDLFRPKMASPFYRLFLVVSVCAPVYCVPPSSGPCPSPTRNTATPWVSSSNTNFAFRLYRRLVLKTPDQNVFFSPLSISASLATLSLGARSATKTQILQGLGFNLTHEPESAIHRAFQHLLYSLSVPSKGLDLRMGSVLFIKKELRLQTNFLDDVKRLYDSKVFSTDFSSTSTARKRINSYVEKETKGKVVDLIQDLDPLTAMVLVNPVFFKAKWEKPFHPGYTRKSSPFLVGQGATVKVPMMHQVEQFAFGVDPELSCSVLQMEYSGNTVAFFVLPGQGKMRQLEQALSARTLRRWSLLLRKRWIEVFIPKFSISASYDLETILPKMGIWDAFSNNADFSGITKTDFLQLSKVAHKAVLDVSEEGTEAAAATATKLIVRSKDSPSYTVIRFNRSFLLLLINKATEAILFLGKVENPTKS
uniref:Serpin family A member 9 n=2 Tax=Lynx canadensis TaxID=61383 RepID=A0A667H124_LYNCA